MESTKNEVAKSKSPIKILVVDDREDNLFSIETILEKDGYTIVKASSGRAALKILLHQQDFTLILMDVQMPDMNGIETASLIYDREKLKQIPIIFITAHNHDEENIFKGYKTGAVDYIYKPINPELLRVKVSIFVELYHKTHELIIHEKKLLAANKKLEKEIEDRKISEEKIRLLNDQLVQKNTHLKSTNEELDRFAYVASHDLQEPLRKIMLFSDKISAKYPDKIDEDVQVYLQKITKASSRMQSLINDLLKLSRHAIHVDDYALIDLNVLFNDVVADFELELEKINAQVHIGRMPSIKAIPGLMQQLFHNLFSNAIKFRRKDIPLAISIVMEPVSEPTYSVTNNSIHNTRFFKILITDNGIGFDQKYAEDVFAVFKRLHSYHEIEGTGIGLSICKRIVEKHNGSISVSSTINEGSTFTIILPENIHEPIAV